MWAGSATLATFFSSSLPPPAGILYKFSGQSRRQWHIVGRHTECTGAEKKIWAECCGKKGKKAAEKKVFNFFSSLELLESVKMDEIVNGNFFLSNVST